MKALPWFRMYHEALDDEKLRLLAFEDRWHFVALLCCKAKGILDEGTPELIHRKVAVKLGLASRELDEVARRLADVDLISKDTLQPNAWASRQCHGDKDETNSQRQARYRASHKLPVTGSNALRNAPSNGSVTGIDTDTEEDIDKEVDKKKTKQLPPPEGVSSSVWSDFLHHRKTKKAAVTQTAIDGIAREAIKAGITLNDSLAMCCERGWVGFKADWVNAGNSSNLNKQESLEARNRDIANKWALGGCI